MNQLFGSSVDAMFKQLGDGRFWLVPYEYGFDDIGQVADLAGALFQTRPHVGVGLRLGGMA